MVPCYWDFKSLDPLPTGRRRWEWKGWGKPEVLWQNWVMGLFVFWCDCPQWAMASSFLRFLGHTQRRVTVCRTPLDEWSARRRDLYLTTHNTHNKQTSMPPGGIWTHDLSRRAAADLLLRPHGYWDRQYVLFTNTNVQENYRYLLSVVCLLWTVLTCRAVNMIKYSNLSHHKTFK